MTREEHLAYLNSLPTPPEPPSIRRKPKPVGLQLVAGTDVVSEAPTSLNLEEVRATNRRREAKLLAEEKRQLRETWKRMLDYRKRHGHFPPTTAAEEARRREEALQIQRQQSLDYHIEMKLFHEQQERFYRQGLNEFLPLW